MEKCCLLESKWKIKYDLLRLNYVARYTGSLLFLFERTNNFFFILRQLLRLQPGACAGGGAATTPAVAVST